MNLLTCTNLKLNYLSSLRTEATRDVGVRSPKAHRQYRSRLNYRSDNRIARVMPLYIVLATLIMGAIEPPCLLNTSRAELIISK